MCTQHKNEIPATFLSLNDDVLHNILEFVGKNSFATFGSVNKKCNQIYKIFDLPKKSFIGGLPVSMVHPLYYGQINIPTVDFDENYRRSMRMMRSIATGISKFNYRELLYWAFSTNNETLLTCICEDAAGHFGNTEILRDIYFLAERLSYEPRCNWDKSICETAAYWKKWDVLKWLRKNNLHQWCEEVSYNTATHGNLEFLTWLYEDGCPFSDLIFARLIYYGYPSVEMLNWLYKKNFELTCHAFDEAAERWDLTLMKWLYDHQCPWDENVFCAAAASLPVWEHGTYDMDELGTGSIKVFKWLHDRNCPWDESTCLRVVDYGGNLEGLQWLRQHGCPWDAEKCIEGAKSNKHLDEDEKLEIIQWIQTQM